MGFFGDGAIGVHALRRAGGVQDERFVAVLEIVSAPAAPYRVELGNYHRDISRGRGLACARGRWSSHGVATRLLVVHEDDGRRGARELCCDAPDQTADPNRPTACADQALTAVAWPSGSVIPPNEGIRDDAVGQGKGGC